MKQLLSQSAEAYHAADGISRSSLEWLTPPRTPAHWKAKFIDKVIPEEETPAMRLGSVTHRCVLEPDTIAGAYHVKPDGMNFTTKDGKAWREEHSDRLIITAQDQRDIDGMCRSVWAHRKAADILSASQFEQSAFVSDDGLLLKARFDALPPKGNVIADLKTCEKADLQSVEKAMFEYGLFRQAAFYMRVARLLGMRKDYFVFIFVEKHPPYAVACYTPTDEIIEAGARMTSASLQTLRNCFDADQWPGYSEAIEGCALPAWAMKQLEAS